MHGLAVKNGGFMMANDQKVCDSTLTLVVSSLDKTLYDLSLVGGN